MVSLTRTGRTAHLLSTSHPQAPIFAFTSDEEVFRRLALWWGVRPVHTAIAEHAEAMVQRMEQELKEMRAVSPGNILLVVGAMPLQKGVHTNFVKIHRVT